MIEFQKQSEHERTIREKVLSQFKNVKVWQKRGDRSPYKPLLILWVIGQCLRGHDRLISYVDCCETLEELFRTFGPTRNSRALPMPFYRLRKDRIWELTDVLTLKENADGDVTHGSLCKNEICGGFTEEIYDLLRHDKILAIGVAKMLANDHFPETLHDFVLQATLGEQPYLEIFNQIVTHQDSSSIFIKSFRRRRDRVFRKKILSNYNHRCAVCNFFLEIPTGHWPSLEAAHIM